MTSEKKLRKMPEWNFLCDVYGLKKRVQELYDESRNLAQQCKWSEHLKVASCIIPCLHYLGLKDWIARMLGRMAWSYIRLGEENHAWQLLGYAEQYDLWQAAANYYWSSEYSHRTGRDRFARKCIEQFRSLLVEQLELIYTREMGDLELAVNFYKKLIEVEDKEGSFRERNNQSDIGRYFELRARLEQNPSYFQKATEHYRWASLYTYAACCIAFRYMTSASQIDSVTERLKNYDEALQAIENMPIFADPHIRNILLGFLKLRIATCGLLIDFETLENDPKAIGQIEQKYKRIYEIMTKSLGPDSDSLIVTAACVTSLGLSQAWQCLVSYVEDLGKRICSAEIENADHLDKILDEVQRYLPSYSFLTTPSK